MQKKPQQPLQWQKRKQDLVMDLLNTDKTKLKYGLFLLVLLELALCCVLIRNCIMGQVHV